MRKYIYISVLIILSHPLSAQVQLLLQPPTPGRLLPSDSWRVEVHQSEATELRAYLEGRITYVDGRELVYLRSRPLRLGAGLTRLDPEQVQTVETRFAEGRDRQLVANSGNFSSGNYRLCVTLRRLDDDRELASDCVVQEVENTVEATAWVEQPDGSRQWAATNPAVRWYGTAGVEGFWASRAGVGQTIPRNYARFDLRPGASLLGVPLQGIVHYTTERSALNPDMNTVALQFDAATFRRNLEDLAAARLRELAAARLQANAGLIGQLAELDRLETFFKATDPMRELAAADSLSALLKAGRYEELLREAEQLEAELGRVTDLPRLAAIEAELTTLRVQDGANESAHAADRRRLEDAQNNATRLRAELALLDSLRQQLQSQLDELQARILLLNQTYEANRAARDSVGMARSESEMNRVEIVRASRYGEWKNSDQLVQNKRTELERLEKLILEIQGRLPLPDQERKARMATLETERQRLLDQQKQETTVRAEKSSRLKAVRQLLEKLKNAQQQLAAFNSKKRELTRLWNRRSELQAIKDKLMSEGGLDNLMQGLTSPSELANTTVLKSVLKDNGLMVGTNKLLFGLRGLTLGTVYPTYSPLTLNGVQVTGGSLEINPGPFYLSICSGRSQSAILNSDSLGASVYRRHLLAARAGLGKAYGTHVFVTAMRFLDDGSSLAFQQTPPPGLNPGANTILGTSFQLSIAKNKLELAGEVAGLLNNRNVNDSSNPIAEENLNRIPDWLKPNLSSSVDYAYNVRLRLNLFRDNTRINVFSRYTGPGYLHAGVPGLRNDVLAYEANIEQHLWRRRIRLAANYRLEEDNLIGSKGIATTAERFGGELQLRIPKFPLWSISYLKHLQENHFAQYQGATLQTSLSYSYKIGGLRAVTNAFYTDTRNAADSLFQQYDASYAVLNQLIVLSQRATLQVQGNYISSNIGSLERQILGGSAGMLLRIFKAANLNLSLLYQQSPDQDRRLGGRLEVNFPINRMLRWQLRANLNDYLSPIALSGSFQEFFVMSNLLINW